MQKKYLVESFSALKAISNRSKAQEEQLFKLRRTIESAGIPTNVSATEMLDYALVIDNMGKVTGYLRRMNGAKTRYARKSNGRKAGRIAANQLEAQSIKNLGFTSVDTRHLEKLISEIAVNKRNIHRIKKSRITGYGKHYDIDDEADLYDNEEFEGEEDIAFSDFVIVGAQA